MSYFIYIDLISSF